MAFVTIDNDEKFRGFLAAIFSDGFMARHTNFTSFKFFRYASAVIANWEAEKMTYDEELMELFVKESTGFESFEQMIRTAIEEKWKETNE